MKWVICLFTGFFIGAPLLATDARIVHLSGDVDIRRGVDEAWHPAVGDMLLREIDTIRTGEDGDVTLQLDGQVTFRLGHNAILDISDLRRISERELFLFLMQDKVQKIERREQQPALHITDVTVVHAEDKNAGADQITPDTTDAWEQERNGAQALMAHRYFPNTIIKLHRAVTRYPDAADCGEMHFLLGQAFEEMKKPGQALEAYKSAQQRRTAAADQCTAGDWQASLRSALERLQEN